MTMIDKLATFCTATSVAASAGTALIGSQIDLSTLTSRPGAGQPVYLVIIPTTEIITGGNAGTIRFELASDSTASIATDATATVICASPTYATDGTDANDAQLKVGNVILCQPIDVRRSERYLGIRCVTVTTTTTAGAITAFLTTNPAAYLAYPNAI